MVHTTRHNHRWYTSLLITMLSWIYVIATIYIVGRVVNDSTATVLVIASVIPTYIAWRRGHPWQAWWAFSLLIWPVALIASIVTANPKKTECPHCLEQVNRGATRCPHCQGEQPAGL